ncbi:MAG: DNA polymerase IV [Chloroflexi bacterium]|jgi:DNA polymerase IV|nr:DNA polymerase IV [Chloroflexota bacterium]MBT7081440.1 DNA polymerase IV [Chloroflexota bacterium]MBT7289835.1 DNA polymerase IV [Chloroflexota bacterium]
MPRQILHIDLDAFFVSVEQMLNPELRGKPVVVGGHVNTRGVIAAASYEAREFGLKSGMSIVKAHRLCPHAIFVPGKFSHYIAASKKFMAILAEYTPDIEPMGLDEAYLDMTGFEPLYGPVKQTAQTIRERISSDIGITASIGISTSKVVSKVAANLCKPDGLLEVAPGHEQQLLAPLPIGKLPFVGPKTEKKLAGLGIKTVGDLAKWPVNLLTKMFGIHGQTLNLHAKGIDASVVASRQHIKSISRETTFAKDTLDIAYIKANLRYLSERVGAALRKEGKSAKCVSLKLRYSDFETINRSLTPKQPVDTNESIFDTGVTLLEKAFKARKTLIRLIGIGVSNFVDSQRQLDIFDTTLLKLEHLNTTIDKIRSRYGFGAIQNGATLPLRQKTSIRDKDYQLHTPCLSR